MSASSPKWTPTQRQSIETVDRNVLVSAAAGSGKTSVLAERSAYLVCDAPDPCDVDELLVVTFTDAAAAEMRDRIQKALRTRAANSNSIRLQQQLKLIDHAAISTLHSFCSTVLRQNFSQVGLDPNFTLLDQDEASLLRAETVRELFDNRYEADTTGVFQRFIDQYGDGDDQSLSELVVKTYETLNSVIDPDQWRFNAMRRLREGAETPIEQSELGRSHIASIQESLVNLSSQCISARKQVIALKTFPGYVAALDECATAIQSWQQTLATSGPDGLIEKLDVTFSRLPSVKQDVANKDLAKKLVDDVRESVKKGTWRRSLQTTKSWQEALQSILEPAELFLDLVSRFGQLYRDAKARDSLLDFSDLERQTYRALVDQGQPSTIAQRCRRRFRHVLVDEYQDINELQDAILSLVSHPNPKGNLFCVGDVKQSIYRFRLAEPALFLKRQEAYRSKNANQSIHTGMAIDLQANFRSRAPLLSAINGVFERLMTRTAADFDYDLSHRLIPGQTYPDAPGGSHFTGAPIELHLLPDKIGTSNEQVEEAEESFDLDRSEREAQLLARRILSLMGRTEHEPRQVVFDSESKAYRPIEFRDFVVLLRAMSHKSVQYARILRSSGIPVNTDSRTGFFDATEIQDILALLKLLDNQRQDIPLASVLRSPLAGLADADDCLARIRIMYRPTDRKSTTGNHSAQTIPFHMAVARYAEEQSDELADRLRTIFQQLDHWRRIVRARPLSETLWHIYQDSAYLTYVSGLHNGRQRMANLVELREKAGKFDSFRKQGLGRFLAFLADLEEESDLGQPSIASQAEDAVRIMSIHRSKGLEFPVVLVPDLGKKINQMDTHGSILVDRLAGLGIMAVEESRGVRYPTLAHTIVKDRLRQQLLAEELRVLYVAMTRAKEHLILVGACNFKKIEQWRSRWSTHKGSLPAEEVLSVSSMLDWIGPTWAATETEQSPIYTLHEHDEFEVLGWSVDQPQYPTFSPIQHRIRKLQPIEVPTIPDPMAGEVLARLRFVYPYENLARSPASRSVTSIAEKTTNKADQAQSSIQITPLTPIPTAKTHQASTVEIESSPSASDIGSATHLVLQYFDFTRPVDRSEVQLQIQHLVDRQVLEKRLQETVDIDSVLWFLNSEVGQLICQHTGVLLRELPVNFALRPHGIESNDPLDRTIVRGRLDLLIPAPSGQIIVDYKTDRVNDQTIKERIELYRGQMLAYRHAIEGITGQPVRQIWLAFLSVRTNVLI